MTEANDPREELACIRRVLGCPESVTTLAGVLEVVQTLHRATRALADALERAEVSKALARTETRFRPREREQVDSTGLLAQMEVASRAGAQLADSVALRTGEGGVPDATQWVRAPETPGLLGLRRCTACGVLWSVWGPSKVQFGSMSVHGTSCAACEPAGADSAVFQRVELTEVLDVFQKLAVTAVDARDGA